MGRRLPVQLEFTDFDDPGLMAAVEGAAARGAGWINLEPVVDEQHLPERPGAFAFLAGPSHEVPTATWVPGRHTGGETKATTVGLEHAAGRRLAWRLADLGAPLPDGWRVTQDHPRRGLVISVPAAADPRAVVMWLLRLTDAVCAVPSTGRWRAEVHAGSAG